MAKKDHLGLNILISVAASFMLTVYGPLMIYFANHSEFKYDAWNVLECMLPVMLACAAAGALVLFLAEKLSRRLYEVVLAACAIVYFCTFIQSTFLSSHLPLLDGTAIDWSQYDGQRLPCIVLWVIVSALLILAGVRWKEKFGKLLKYAVSAVLAFQLLTLALSGPYDRKADISVSADHLSDMSTDRNFIIFLFDMVDAETLSRLWANHPEYGEKFGDFTLFTNVVGGFPFTEDAVPLILGGVWGGPEDTDYWGFVQSAIDDSPLFQSLAREKYSMNLYMPDYNYVGYNSGLFHNIREATGLANPKNFVKMQLKLSGMQALPYDLKKYSVETPADMSYDSAKGADNLYREWNDAVYDSVSHGKITLVEDRQFKFIYCWGAHTPFEYDAEVNKISDGTYEQSVEACMTIAGDYVDQLKAAGVYDNSIIIFMSDHGYSETEMIGRQNPFLMIKGVGEKHEFVMNDAPLSQNDYMQAYDSLLQGKHSKECFDWTEGDIRPREHWLYYWDGKNMVADVYIQNGHASDESTMVFDRPIG